MLNSYPQVFITFAKSDRLIFVLDVVRLELVELLSLFVFLGSKLGDPFVQFALLFSLLADRHLILSDALMHLSNEIPISFDFGLEFVLSILLIHLNVHFEVILLLSDDKKRR